MGGWDHGGLEEAIAVLECHITDVGDDSLVAPQASAEPHELLKAQLGLTAPFLCRVM